MGTRSIIIVTGRGSYGPETIRLYKHWDGYPTDNLPLMLGALTKAKAQCEASNKRFNSEDNIKKPIVSQVAGLIIGESSNEYGMGCYVDAFEGDDGQYQESFKAKHLGNQGDLEWLYILNLDDKSLNIYGAYYGSGKEMMIKGVVNPESYANQLHKEYQEREIKETRALVSEFEAIGFSINKAKQKRSRKKVA